MPSEKADSYFAKRKFELPLWAYLLVLVIVGAPVRLISGEFSSWKRVLVYAVGAVCYGGIIALITHIVAEERKCLLPERVTCTKCGKRVELGLPERQRGVYICPSCGGENRK